MSTHAITAANRHRQLSGLSIQTFSNVSGGNTLYKALAHPLAAERVPALMESLRRNSPAVLYDPLGQAESFASLYDLSPVRLDACLAQRVEDLEGTRFGHKIAPVTILKETRAKSLFIAAFDAGRLVSQVAHLIPDELKLLSFDDLRLPDALIGDRRRYLNAMNFATNFAFFRDAGGAHTRLVSANYWYGHGAAEVALWLRLYDTEGRVLAEWRQELDPGVSSVIVDSREIRSRFSLPEFTGSLFIHVVGAAGHDVVKYALDFYGDAPGVLTATHDANAWPADYYAGLPAPAKGEKVLLWIQNSHGVPIPPGTIGLNPMGLDENTVWVDAEIPPFGTRAINVGELLPDISWPRQIEIQAGRQFVRPRYEVLSDSGRSRIAHVNVERTDLGSDPDLPKLQTLLGKGYLLPAPVLPPDRWTSVALPTPMARSQSQLPLAVIVYDAGGREAAREFLGCLPRGAATEVDLNTLLAQKRVTLSSGYGHLELLYDFTEGGEGDGWLHGIFRYRDRASNHAAETSFGSHIYNTAITYRDEPQSYIGRPPGLSTRLFLRVGPQPLKTMMHLIYPASRAWHPQSTTELNLFDGSGTRMAGVVLNIPCSGSRLVYLDEIFSERELHEAGDGAYVIVRDRGCRLFGYHGLLGENGSFSFDHMFGF